MSLTAKSLAYAAVSMLLTLALLAAYQMTTAFQ
jgi:hypothetical protein